jgi:hypothetical protein
MKKRYKKSKKILKNNINLNSKRKYNKPIIKNKTTKFNKKYSLIMISKQDMGFLADSGSVTCPGGNILGAYHNDTILIKDSGEKANKRTLLHEIGHNVWGKVDSQTKERWNELFTDTDEFVTPYASVNANEDFSESFSCYFTGYEGCENWLMEAKLELMQEIINSFR